MIVQAWLGHKTYTTTLKYAQMSKTHLRGVVDVLNGSKQFDRSLTLDGLKGGQAEQIQISRSVTNQALKHARVVKLVDTRDLKSLARKGVPVRFRPRAPTTECIANKKAA